MARKYRQVFVTIMIGVWILATPAERIHAAAADPVARQVNTILDMVEHNQWEAAVSPTRQLKHVFNKNKWKYQLLGDEEEYEELDREIDKLRAAVKEKDSVETKIIIATILSIVEEIYSL